MRLSDRLGHDLEQASPSSLASQQFEPEPAKEDANDPLGNLKLRAQETLFEVLGDSVTKQNMGTPAMQREINLLLDQIIAEDKALLSRTERKELIDSVTDNLLGLGPIQRYVDDPTVTEIMVNAPDSIYIERHGRIEEADASFYSDAHVRTTIERIVAAIGRRIDESTPMVDARLEDGSRVNAVLPPLSIDSPTLTIRKFADVPIGIDQLIAYGTLSAETTDFLRACVRGRCNVFISGGTGSGKTTLLNVLSSFIPEGERIITIEDTAELRLQQRHVVRMEARPANNEGAGQVDIRDLVRNSLRMRPDRIVVGECRGPEALDMLQAMNTGHEGSITTLHANSTRDALARVETMVLMSGMDLPLRAIREQVSSAVDLVVHVARLGDGQRRIVEVSEVVGMEGDVMQINPIFELDWDAGRDEAGALAGGLRPTGIRPRLADRLEQHGLPLHPSLFETEV
ncbi:MAG: CpaF family protein [Acidimicrobiales bacterium]